MYLQLLMVIVVCLCLGKIQSSAQDLLFFVVGGFFLLVLIKLILELMAVPTMFLYIYFPLMVMAWLGLGKIQSSTKFDQHHLAFNMIFRRLLLILLACVLV